MIKYTYPAFIILSIFGGIACSVSISQEPEGESPWSNIGDNTYRMIDKEYGIICYQRYNSSGNLNCVKIKDVK